MCGGVRGTVEMHERNNLSELKRLLHCKLSCYTGCVPLVAFESIPTINLYFSMPVF